MEFDLDEFIKKSIKIKTLSGLFKHYDEAIEQFGFDFQVFIFFPPVRDASQTVPSCPYFNIPEKLISAYLKNEFYRIGPVFEKAKTTGKPIIWSNLLNQKNVKITSELKMFFEMLEPYGFKNGFTLPIFGFSNSFGYFSFSKLQKKSNDNNAEDIVLLSHICTSIFRQYLNITSSEDKSIAKLTAREKEVLTWVLKGKSNSSIATILGISEHTVNTYIRRSSNKMNASSKWGAAISGVLTGVLHH